MIPGSLNTMFLGKGPDTSSSYESNDYDDTNLSTYTFATQAIGDATVYRYVVVGVGFLDTSTSMGAGDGPTSVTIGGISATLIEKASEIDTSFITGASLWIAKVPTGTTASIVVNFSETVTQCQITTYSLIHVNGAHIDSDAVQITAGDTATTAALVTPSVGIAYANIRDNQASVDVAWSGSASPVEDFEETRTYNAYAGAQFSGDGTVAASHTGNEVVALVAATW